MKIPDCIMWTARVASIRFVQICSRSVNCNSPDAESARVGMLFMIEYGIQEYYIIVQIEKTVTAHDYYLPAPAPINQFLIMRWL